MKEIRKGVRIALHPEECDHADYHNEECHQGNKNTHHQIPRNDTFRSKNRPLFSITSVHVDDVIRPREILLDGAMKREFVI